MTRYNYIVTCYGDTNLSDRRAFVVAREPGEAKILVAHNLGWKRYAPDTLSIENLGEFRGAFEGNRILGTFDTSNRWPLTP